MKSAARSVPEFELNVSHAQTVTRCALIASREDHLRNTLQPDNIDTWRMARQEGARIEIAGKDTQSKFRLA